MNLYLCRLDKQILGAYEIIKNIKKIQFFRLKVEIFDYNDDGDHDFIGNFFTTLEEMAEGEGFQIVTWDVMNEKKKAKKDYENSGTVILKSIKIDQVCDTFVRKSFLH